jgi:hypothetical protein
MKLLIVATFTLMLSGCSTLGAIGSFFGSDQGTDVNTNAQVGKENIQQVVGSQTEAGGEAQIADTANRVTGTQIINQEVPPWVWILMIMGWLLPSPQEIYRGIIDLFTLIFGKKK